MVDETLQDPLCVFQQMKKHYARYTPELVHRDPYGEGWLARVRLTAWQADRAALLQGEAVHAAMAQHAWLHRGDE